MNSINKLNYSIHPFVLEHQINQSLKNLGVSTLDCYYLNLPEVLLSIKSEEEVIQDILRAFLFLEEKCEQGVIKNYGLTGWNLGRKLPFTKFHFNFERLITEFEKTILLKKSNFKFIQSPVSLGMPEIFCENYHNSLIEKDTSDKISFLQLMSELELNFFSISPLMNGLMSQVPLPTSIFNASYLVPKHLNFIRSLPYSALKVIIFIENKNKSVIVGMKNNRHVKINCTLGYTIPVEADEIQSYIELIELRTDQPEQLKD